MDGQMSQFEHFVSALSCVVNDTYDKRGSMSKARIQKNFPEFFTKRAYVDSNGTKSLTKLQIEELYLRIQNSNQPTMTRFEFCFRQLAYTMRKDKRLSYNSNGAYINSFDVIPELEAWMLTNNVIGFKTSQQIQYFLYNRPDDWDKDVFVSVFEHPQVSGYDNHWQQRQEARVKGPLTDEALLEEIEKLLIPDFDRIVQQY